MRKYDSNLHYHILLVPVCWSLLFKISPLSALTQASIINVGLELSLCSITRIQNTSIDFSGMLFYFTITKWILIHKRKTLGVKCQLLSNILLSSTTKIVCISSWKYNVYVFTERISINYWCEVLFLFHMIRCFEDLGDNAWSHPVACFVFCELFHWALTSTKCGDFSLCLRRK